MYPNAPKIKLTINQEQKTKTNPTIAHFMVSFPVCNHWGFPAEIRIITPPIVRDKIAKGVAMYQTIKLKILASIIKKLSIVQLGPLQGTNGSWAGTAFVKTGIKNKIRKNKLINKNAFFIFLKLLILDYYNTKIKGRKEFGFSLNF